jgi:hypothetical protein
VNTTDIKQGGIVMKFSSVAFVLSIAAAAFVGAALAQTSTAWGDGTNSSLPDLAGTYKCEGDETACGWSGWTFTMTQSGSDLEIKNEKGDVGRVKLTSRISLSAGPIWNMLGTIVSPDNSVIQWSNGTTWRKQ